MHAKPFISKDLCLAQPAIKSMSFFFVVGHCFLFLFVVTARSSENEGKAGCC